MKKCANCNIEYSDDELFCAECGQRLTEVGIEPARPVQQAANQPAQPKPLYKAVC